MCSDKVLEFGNRVLTAAAVAGKRVLDVGSRVVQDPSMTLRHRVQALGPANYLGVDMEPGVGVDEICSVLDLERRFGAGAFDLVLSTELMEHIEDWRSMIANFKRVVKPGGFLLLTTRAPGFPYHGWPCDYWRFAREDMAALFADFEMLALEDDPKEPGVFLWAQKPLHHVERTPDLLLHSVLTGRRTAKVGRLRRWWFLAVLRARRTWIATVPESTRTRIYRLLGRKGRHAD